MLSLVGAEEHVVNRTKRAWRAFGCIKHYFSPCSCCHCKQVTRLMLSLIFASMAWENEVLKAHICHRGRDESGTSLRRFTQSRNTTWREIQSFWNIGLIAWLVWFVEITHTHVSQCPCRDKHTYPFFLLLVGKDGIFTIKMILKPIVKAVTNLCWTAPRQSPHSAPSDHTGSAWSRPLPPPQTGRPLWSKRTPPLFECRHLTDKCSQIISVAPLVVRCLARPRWATSLVASEKPARETKKRLPAYTAQSCFTSLPLIFSFCFVLSPLFHVNSACLVSFVL